MSSLFDRLDDRQARDFADKIGDIFKSLPKLPPGIVDFLVKVVPYLALLGAVLFAIVTPLGVLGTLFSLLSLNPMVVLAMVVATGLMVVQGVLLFMAYKPLKNLEERGWMLLFWSEVLFAVSTIFDILGGGSWVGNLLGLVIGFYILFQMRPRYTAMAEVIAKTVKE